MSTKLNDLFFPVDNSPIKVHNVTISKYYAITEQYTNIFLGIKGQRQKYVTNDWAYSKSLNIYYQLTQREGKPFNWFMNKDRNKSAVIVSDQSLDQFVSKFRGEVLFALRQQIPSMFESSSFKESVDGANNAKVVTEDQFESFVRNKLNHLDLSVAFVNGYDIDSTCNYYLVIRWKDNDEKLKYLAISRGAESEDIDIIAKDFRKDLIDFILTSFNRYVTTIDVKFIRPILFNIYNQNIEYTTIQNDDKYRNGLILFNDSTHKFVDHLKEYNYYAFTEYIIRNCFLYEEGALNLKIRNKESVITVNKTYQDSISRLKNLYGNEKNRREFEDSNFDRLKGVENMLHNN